jgi:hypothetical protein
MIWIAQLFKLFGLENQANEILNDPMEASNTMVKKLFDAFDALCNIPILGPIIGFLFDNRLFTYQVVPIY